MKDFLTLCVDRELSRCTVVQFVGVYHAGFFFFLSQWNNKLVENAKWKKRLNTCVYLCVLVYLECIHFTNLLLPINGSVYSLLCLFVSF